MHKIWVGKGEVEPLALMCEAVCAKIMGGLATLCRFFFCFQIGIGGDEMCLRFFLLALRLADCFLSGKGPQKQNFSRHSPLPYYPHKSKKTKKNKKQEMPHSIRNYYLGHVGPTATGTNGHSSGASNLSNTGIPPRGYSSNFNTSYNTNPANLPSYNYTNRHMQRAAAAAAAAAAASGNPGPHPPSSTATASTNTGSWTSRVPQYPPLQYQYYGGGSGYSSTYHGGTNGDRYNASYSHHGGSSQSKSVCRMDCRYCSAVVCLRGMKAMLLADTSVELYSTDHPPGS